MTEITSYRQAAAIFAKARKPKDGKPLHQSAWRMFKDGDEYVVNYRDTQVARFLPSNTLMLAAHSYRQPWVCVENVLPIRIVLRAKGHYRVHPQVLGSDKEYMTANTYEEFRTGGYRLYDGLTIDLTTRVAVGYREPRMVTDPLARRDWLDNCKWLKLHLKTVAKLGGLSARIEALRSGTKQRWEVNTMVNASPGDLAIVLDALNGGDTEPLVQRVAESLHRAHWTAPTTAAQLRHIDHVFISNSLALRKALNVIKEV